MKLGYAWQNDSLYPGTSASEVGSRLSELEAEHGELTKDIILKEARRRESPLYGLIERDAPKALEIYQREQARKLVNALRVVKNGRKTNKRAFVYVEPTPRQRKAWVSLVVAMRTPTLRDQVVDRAVQEFDRWFDRYGDLTAFRPVRPTLLKVRDKIEAELLAAVD